MDKIWEETLERISCLEGLVDKLAVRLAKLDQKLKSKPKPKTKLKSE